MLLTSWLRSLIGSLQSDSSRAQNTRPLQRRSAWNRRSRSVAGAVEALEERSLLAVNWVANGPGQIQNGQAAVGLDDQVVGSVTAVLADPFNSATLYVGTANGGIWKTDDADSGNPHWVNLTDSQTSTSLSISAMAIDPQHANVMVAATSKVSNFSSTGTVNTPFGGPTGRLLITSDSGATWTELAPAALAGQTITALAVRNNGANLIVTTKAAGILVSTDGGASFSRAVGIEISQYVPANVEIGDKFTLKPAAGNAITFTATAATVANVTAGLTAAWNLDLVNKNLATAVDTGTSVILNGKIPGDLNVTFTPVNGSEIDLFTPANVEIGDVFKLTLTVGLTTTTVQYTATAATVANVTAGLKAAWEANPTTNAAATATDVGPGTGLRLTGTNPGALDVTGTAVNGVEIDQFIPTNVEIGDVFTLSIAGVDSVSYTATAANVANVVIGLRDAWNGNVNLAAIAAATTNVGDTLLKLTGVNPGTFTPAILSSTVNKSQIDQYVPVNVEVGDSFSLTIGPDTVSFVSTDGTPEEVVAGLLLAWNNNANLFAVATATNANPGVLVLEGKLGTAFVVTPGSTNGVGNPNAPAQDLQKTTTQTIGTNNQTLGKTITQAVTNTQTLTETVTQPVVDTQTLTQTFLQTATTPAGGAYDVVGDPSSFNSNVLYASLVTPFEVTASNGVLYVARGIYKSTDFGVSWTLLQAPPLVNPPYAAPVIAMRAQILNGALGGTLTSNIKLAVTHVGSTQNLFVAIVNDPDTSTPGDEKIAGFWRSGDGGTTWIAMDTPPVTPGSSSGDKFLTMVGDRFSANIVYVGGGQTSSALYRGDANLGQGSQFVSLNGNFTLDNSTPHAGPRDMVVDIAGNLVEVDDGGVYLRSSPKSVNGFWESAIGNLPVTEVHDIAWDSLSNVTLIGAVDVGNAVQSAPNSSVYTYVSATSGGDVAIDDSDPQQSIRYTSGLNLANFRKRTYGTTGTLISSTTPQLQVIAGNSIVTQNITPIALNTIDPKRLLIAGLNGYYESFDQGNSLAQISSNSSGTSLGQNAIVYGGTHAGVTNKDVIYAASGNKLLFRETFAGQLNSVFTFSSQIRDITVNPNDYYGVWVITATGVFRSQDRGATFVNITGDLPAQLGNPSQFRTMEYIKSPVTSAVVVGTDRGVFYSMTSDINVGDYNWQRFGTALPSAQVYDMEYDKKDNVLVIGLVGRGTYIAKNASSEIVGTNPTITNPGPQSTPEDTPKNVGVTVGDKETAAGSLVVSATSNDQSLVKDANLTFSGSGALRILTITPEPGKVGAVSINVTVFDGNKSATETFTLTISPVNNQPTVVSKQVIVSGNTPTNVQLNANDGDPDVVQNLTYNQGTPPQHGSISNFNSITGEFTYTPATGYIGFDTFEFSVTDDASAGSPANRTSATGTITFKVVSPTNQPPTISQVANQTIKEDTATFDLPFTIGDPDTPLAELTVTAVSLNGAVIPNGNILLKGVGANRSLRIYSDTIPGTATISVTVDDNSGKTTTMSFNVTVTSVIGLWSVVKPQPDGTVQLAQTFVEQAGAELVLTNASGAQSTGRFIKGGTIVADAWGNMTGTVVGNTLRFTNGAIWTKVPDLSGFYVNELGQYTSITQNGLNLQYFYGNTVLYGRFSTDIQSITAGPLTATVSAGTIFFSDGTMVWKKIPYLAGDYLSTTGGTTRIDQSGVSLSLNFGTSTAAFIDSKTIFNSTLGTGNIQVDRIVWSTGVTWQRLPNIDGLWFDNLNSNFAKIRQDVNSLIMSDGAHTVTAGAFLDNKSINTVAFGVGNLSERNRTLQFSSTRWERIVNLETLDDIYTGGDFWPFR